MDDQTQRDLIQRVQTLERQAIKYRQGVITDDSPLSVALGGSDTPFTDVKRLDDGATLAVDDLVAVLTFGNDLLVLGRIV